MRFRQSASHVRRTVLWAQRSGAFFRSERPPTTASALRAHIAFSGFHRCFLHVRQGFCCSCLHSVNAARQPRPYADGGKTAADVPATDGANDMTLRGEPDCTNLTASPSYANPFTYHESSHCFRYSDLWSVRYAFFRFSVLVFEISSLMFVNL